MTPDELKRFRTELKISQKEMAGRLGVQPSKLCEWENGIRKIPKYIQRLLDCLHKERGEDE